MLHAGVRLNMDALPPPLSWMPSRGYRNLFFEHLREGVRCRGLCPPAPHLTIFESHWEMPPLGGGVYVFSGQNYRSGV